MSQPPVPETSPAREVSPAPEAMVAGPGSPLHVEEERVSLRGTPPEGWVALAIFWLLGITVLLQFVTRYALNDSAAWTEEIARYLLICTVFVGAVVGVRSSDHIRVDLLYRYLPERAGHLLGLWVEAFSVVFFGALALLAVQMMVRLGDYRMTAVDLPMNVVFGVCALALGAMAVRAALVLRGRWRGTAPSGE
ncbi:MAG: putative small permease component [Pseudomonadota bacterium]|jgi:TRAP-type C4-dicarboxylate transport system permease small subunit